MLHYYYTELYSTLLLITGNNKRLDKDGTIPFGTIDDKSMLIVDRIYDGYKGGQGQIASINNNSIAKTFPKMSRIDFCKRSA